MQYPDTERPKNQLGACVAKKHRANAAVAVERLCDRQREENPVWNRDKKNKSVSLRVAAEHRRQQQADKIRDDYQQPAQQWTSPTYAQRSRVNYPQHLREH